LYSLVRYEEISKKTLTYLEERRPIAASLEFEAAV
jgi:hypothetical protein